MEPLEPYYKRLRKRLWKDAAPWARDNIVWAVLGVVVPPLALYLHDSHAQIDWPLIKIAIELYGFALAIYFLVQLCRTPKKLDGDRDAREIELGNLITDKEQLIRQRDQSISAMAEEPRRTPAEQHNYDKLKRMLEIYKETGIAALRHIRNVGTLTFGGAGAVTLPAGLTVDKALWVYRGCAAEALLIHVSSLGLSQETFSVPENLGKIFDDALY